MSDAAQPPVVTTEVGLSLFGDNAFRGRRMSTEVVGKDGFWSMMSQCLGGPPLDRERERCIDDIAVCSQAADPRVWPLKLARLVSSYGSSISGLCAAMLASEAALIGPWTAQDAASQLQALGELDPADREPSIRASLAAGKRFSGYGVPLRPIDERVLAMRDLLPTRYPTLLGKYWALAHQIEHILVDARGLHMNISAAVGSVCLDIGLAPEVIGPLSLIHATTSFLAHSWEGSHQRSETLQRLPDSVVRYVGPPARPSPRATEDDGGSPPP